MTSIGKSEMYITLKIRAKTAYHGYDADNKLITSPVGSTEFVEKIIRLDRILSFTEEYVFIECPHDTVQTWEYEGSIADIKQKLSSAGLML